MKRQAVKAKLSVLGMTAPAVSAAETETETVSTELETETEETEAETEAAPDVEVKKDGETIVTLKNESGYVVKEAVVGAAEEETAETETEAESEGTVTGLTLTGEDGGKDSLDPATLSLSTERLTQDYPRHATSLLNLVKNAEESMRALHPAE